MRKKRIKLSGIVCLSIAGYFCYSLSVNASEIQNSQETNTAVATTTPQNSVSNTTASAWGLSVSEWEHYVKLMQGPDGLWYEKLSPPAVLGLNAATDKERQHYADIVAQQEHDKVARELKFNHEVYLALRKDYPAEPVIQPFDKTPFNPRHGQGGF